MARDAGRATRRIALGTAAAVLPLRHPLHVAKAALSLNRLSQERFILGLGSGDREAEFAIFKQDIALRGDAFRERWNLVRSALSPEPAERAALHEATGGHDLMAAPAERIGMLVVGSARQSLQWTAAHADGWATYHRDEARQQGRIGLWQTALRERAGSEAKPFIQSLQIDLLEDADAPAEPIELGLRTGRMRWWRTSTAWKTPRGACADERGARQAARRGGGRRTRPRGAAPVARPCAHADRLSRAESGACSFFLLQDTTHDRSLELPHHEEMARAAPRAAAAVFAAHAQRREGVDHAGGNRPAL
ncbi:LLM class flavin-dependent oxidoreductase [Variovorax sp. E3]|uniref:LLM class flavin-dependent oxidoreductase n=1 Tax=Variovorax sp. E3 TaxID=1914993 RepID=UPI0027DBDAC1|nr:LLM class flavin-dependent oxidoreductase [Variovorax sp. E3]